LLAKTAAVILAAGAGTRMKSTRPKVLFEILDRPLVHFPVLLAQRLGLMQTVVVVGHGRTAVEESVAAIAPDARFALQAEQRGTGHAVMAAESATTDAQSVLILSGDVPSLTDATVAAMVSARERTGAPMSMLTFEAPDPTGYGRVVVDEDGRVEQIVEHRDCTETQREITTVNAGVYLADRAALYGALARVGTANDQGEYYLTDVCAILAGDGAAPVAVDVAPDEVEGINDRAQLAELAERVRMARNTQLMRDGVTMLDPQRTWVGFDVALEPDVTLHSGATLRGTCSVGAGTVISEGCVLTDAVVGADALIKPYCVIAEARIGNKTAVGPFAHLRPGTVLGEKAKIGNFVETKKAIVGDGSKASHLTYLGDCELGRDVNIGAGTITCNYDGVGKHQTIIEDRVFVGSNTEIVAPARLGEESVVAAGTTVTADVPAYALVVSRVRQHVVEAWARRRGPVARKRRKDEEKT